jgi:hypothetical protein
MSSSDSRSSTVGDADRVENMEENNEKARSEESASGEKEAEAVERKEEGWLLEFCQALHLELIAFDVSSLQVE